MDCKTSNNQPMYRLKKSSQLFRKCLQNSATKHLNLQNPRFEFFQLKKSWGVSRTFGYVSLSEKRAKKRTSSPGITA